MQPQPQSKLTEIAVLAIVALLIASGVFLLYVGKIDFTGILTLFGFAGTVLGINGALKAPSPAQQAQNNALFAQLMNVLPGLFAQLQPPTVTVHNNIPATPVQAAQLLQAPPLPSVPVQITPATGFVQTPLPPQQAFAAPLAPPSWTQQTPSV